MNGHMKVLANLNILQFKLNSLRRKKNDEKLTELVVPMAPTSKEPMYAL
jgi:hypothetical protein